MNLCLSLVLGESSLPQVTLGENAPQPLVSSPKSDSSAGCRKKESAASGMLWDVVNLRGFSSLRSDLFCWHQFGQNELPHQASWLKFTGRQRLQIWELTNPFWKPRNCGWLFIFHKTVVGHVSSLTICPKNSKSRKTSLFWPIPSFGKAQVYVYSWARKIKGTFPGNPG